MSLRDRIRESTNLTPQEKLIMGILADCIPVTADEIIDRLMSEPYELAYGEVMHALDSLKDRNLFEIDGFYRDNGNFRAKACLTFAQDWVLKI